MATKPVKKIVTANDLFEGDVIYFKSDHGWSRLIGKAAIADSKQEADALLDVARNQADKIVGAYLMPVELDSSGTPAPVHFREDFRTRGPSNYFHGKQADLKKA